MEKTFNKFKLGYKLKADDVTGYSNNYKKESTLIEQGIIIYDEGNYIINPIAQRCKTYSTAKLKIRKTSEAWLEALSREKENQESFKEAMVDYYIKEVGPIKVTKSNNDTIAILEGLKHNFANGKGLAYVINNELIAWHYGYTQASNAPSDCTVLKARSEGDVLFLG